MIVKKNTVIPCHCVIWKNKLKNWKKLWENYDVYNSCNIAKHRKNTTKIAWYTIDVGKNYVHNVCQLTDIRKKHGHIIHQLLGICKNHGHYINQLLDVRKNYDEAYLYNVGAKS